MINVDIKSLFVNEDGNYQNLPHWSTIESYHFLLRWKITNNISSDLPHLGYFISYWQYENGYYKAEVIGYIFWFT